MTANQKFIAQDNLAPALEALARKMKVWVPVASPDKPPVVRFLPFAPGVEVTLDRLTTTSPKSVVLPQAQTLLRFEYIKDAEDASKLSLNLDRPEAPGPALLFGARPCDLKALSVFDSVMADGPYQDDLYTAGRENLLVAALVCREGDDACFCSAVGGGPAELEGSDISITPVTGGFVLEALSEKAHPVLDVLGEPATDSHVSEAAKVRAEVSEKVVGGFVPGECQKAFRARFEKKEYWEEFAGGCISCGACTFACPTCYCFTITDEMPDLKGERLRTWDSCMFFHYTLEASGHNPRPTKLERYRNRVGHKFSYYPERYGGKPACCGCGRCIRLCPASIDIRNVVMSLEEKPDACAQ